MEKLLNKLNIKYNDVQIYVTALTHPSFVHEHPEYKIHNQRLEFLGDAIFDLVVTEYLYNNLSVDEGKMTKLRAGYVCEAALCSFANAINLKQYVRVGKGEQHNIKDAIIADAFEAFIAAIYLDVNYDEVENFFNNYIKQYLDEKTEFYSDFKSKLQELVQLDKRTIRYEVVKQEGASHNPVFYVNVIMDDIILGSGLGKTKKSAEQDAAKNALEKMAK